MIYSLTLHNNEVKTGFYLFPNKQYHYQALHYPIIISLIWQLRGKWNRGARERSSPSQYKLKQIQQTSGDLM